MQGMSEDQEIRAERMITNLVIQGQIDAISARNAFLTEFGERLDWHPFSFLLDSMAQRGAIRFVGTRYGGMCQYAAVMKL